MPFPLCLPWHWGFALARVLAVLSAAQELRTCQKFKFCGKERCERIKVTFTHDRTRTNSGSNRSVFCFNHWATAIPILDIEPIGPSG